MREIKFKFWDSKEKEMLGEYPLASIAEDAFTFHIRDYIIPLQFTGLLDKNGKKIYEGDIVNYDYNSEPITHHALEQVQWDYEWGCWKFGIYMLEPTIKNTLEIIGNIYENPDLLTNNK